MTTISLVRGLRVCASFAFASISIVAPLAAQSGGQPAASSSPKATYPSNPRSGTPVRPVSGPANPESPPVYGPQPAAPIKEPGAAPPSTKQQMPLPSGRPAQLQPAQPGQAATPRQPMSLRAPEWFPLDQAHATRLDEILNYWEQESNKIERYQCKFKRWEYDPVFGPKPGVDGIDIPKSYAEGLLQYKKPDKGNFQVQLSKVYVAPKTEEAKPTYEKQADEMYEHWVCDGKSVFEFDGRKKQLIERPLPPEMQGKSIADGPLPFMFGAKAATIKERYWMRIITPSNAKNEYWLEAHPKNRQDASNFKLVQVIIDEKDFLPKKLTVFMPNFDPRTNAAKTAYVFEERKTNWNETLEKIMKPFEGAFDKPKTPFGWQKIVEKPETAGDGPLPVEVRPITPPGNQAGRPNSTGASGAQATKPQNSKSVK